MGEVIVVSGPPGSGKSTVAALLADRFLTSSLVEGDTFFAFLRRGFIPPWLPEAHHQNTAVVEAAARAAGLLAGHCDVAVTGSTTRLGPVPRSSLKAILRHAHAGPHGSPDTTVTET